VSDNQTFPEWYNYGLLLFCQNTICISHLEFEHGDEPAFILSETIVDIQLQNSP
jgi:hypothetical protein